MAGRSARVLSIQSHVVSGYVGNKSATFPLQVLGFEVDTINSVQLSNHTGYGSWKGQVLHENDLEELMDGLHKNGLDWYTHLLTGYVGSPSFLKKIAQVVQDLRKINPKLIFVCDPVLGDNGKVYVPEELVGIYRDAILPLADIITPNQFEAELLSGKKINSTEEGWAAIEHFHDKGCQTVVVSSTELGDEETLLAMGSSIVGGKKTALTIHIPKIPQSFTGSGDLFTALMLAWMTKTDNQFKPSFEKTVSTLQAVLKRTYEFSKEAGGTEMQKRELQLIQSKEDIENPKITLEAKVL